MKKIRLFAFVALILMLALFLCVGCKKEDKISSIALKDYDPSTVIEIAAGGFDFDAYTVVASYASGATEEITLSEEMIVAADLFKFYQEGESDVTIVYKGLQCAFKISVKRSTFGSLSFSKNNVFTYDGAEHTVEVEGDLPANAVVTYPGGNSFVNVGTYDVTAIVSCEGYVTERLSTTVQIQQAKYDMSGITFESKTVVYDGQVHSLTVSGILPEGVSTPKYYVADALWSGAKNAGVYTVQAVFSHSDPNYAPISSMEATLTIQKAKHDVGDLRFSFTDQQGTLLSIKEKIYDGTPVFVSLSADTWLPKGTNVSYSLLKDNQAVSDVNSKGPVSLTDAGTYTITASFVLSDEVNYESLVQTSTTFVIHKAPYTVEGVYLESDVFVYDGSARSLVIKGVLPSYLTFSYEYYLNGILQTDADGKPIEAVTEAGKYTVKVVFTHSNENYEAAAAISAELEILQAKIDMSEVNFSNETNIVYDGENHSLILTGPIKPSEDQTPDEENPEEEGPQFESIYTVIPEFVKIEYQYYQRVPCVHKETDSNGNEHYKHIFDEVLLVDENGEMLTSVCDAGEYSVKVIFTVENPNYEDIGSMSAPFTIQKQLVDMGDMRLEGESSYTYDGQAHQWEVTNLPALIQVKKTLYRVEAGEKRTLVDTAVDAGTYVMVFEFSLAEENNHQFDVAFLTTQEEMFYIVPYVIDISGIELENSSVTYDGTNRYPILKETGLPEYVSVTMTVYPSRGRDPITEVVNAGTYRVDVIFATENPNCVLSQQKIELTYKIKPITIVTDGFEYESLTFDYDKNSHLPKFTQQLPEHVILGSNLYVINPLTNDKIYVEEAVAVGTYFYEVWLSPESSNYTLTGQTRYDTEFEIKVDFIIIANLNEVLQQEFIEIPYDDRYSDGYNYNEDDGVFAQTIANAIFGENADYVTCTVGIRHPKLEGVYVLPPTPLEQDTVYVFENFQFAIIPEEDGTYKYAFQYLDNYYYTANAVTIRVKFV